MSAGQQDSLPPGIQMMPVHRLDDSLSPWERRLNKHGWPTVILLFALFVIWRFCVWAAPLIERSTSKHIELIDNTQKTQASQAESNKEIATQTSKLAEIADRQERRTEEIHRDVRDIQRIIISRGPTSP